MLKTNKHDATGPPSISFRLFANSACHTKYCNSCTLVPGYSSFRVDSTLLENCVHLCLNNRKHEIYNMNDGM